ncbi:hypothetical protein BABINDRAFT_28030, partial [Babjeviella inositovora NRRL Y-12698]
LNLNVEIPQVSTYTPRYNLGPTHAAPIIMIVNETATLTTMNWGLIPPWCSPSDKQQPWKTFNARLESINEGAKTWKQPRELCRCMIPMMGYFEWIERRTGSGRKTEKVPYYVSRKDGKLMFVAGMYDAGREGESGSFTMVTGPAIEDLKWLHARTPLIMDPGSTRFQTWLDPKKTWSAEVSAALKPYEGQEMFRWWKVTLEVGRLGPDGENMIKREKEPGTNIFNLMKFKEEEAVKQEVKQEQEKIP